MQPYRYKTALLIDDEVDNIIHASIIRNLFLAQKIITYTSARQAFTFISEMINFGQELPELIFLDTNMPLLNGFEFLDRLKDFPSSVWIHTKIIILSSTIIREEIEKIKAHPYVYTFICKPLSSQALNQLL